MHPSQVKRKRGATLTKGIILGTYSFLLPQANKKQMGGTFTHHWTFLVRAANGEDMSYWVEKVVINLHQSFQEPNRDMLVPPYEVTECGWGEFRIGAEIHLRDGLKTVMKLEHDLKLHFSPGKVPADIIYTPPGQVNGTCVVSETYDELVFHEPPEAFYDLLMAGPPNPTPPPPHRLARHFLRYNEEEELRKIQIASSLVQSEIARLRQELATIEYQCRKHDSLESVKKQQLEEQGAQGGHVVKQEFITQAHGQVGQAAPPHQPHVKAEFPPQQQPPFQQHPPQYQQHHQQQYAPQQQQQQHQQRGDTDMQAE